MKHEVTSRPVAGAPYREHTLTVEGVEVRTQMHAFTPQEIADYVDLYKRMGITTPRHQNKSWNNHFVPAQRRIPGRPEVPEPIVYRGPYIED